MTDQPVINTHPMHIAHESFKQSKSKGSCRKANQTGTSLLLNRTVEHIFNLVVDDKSNERDEALTLIFHTLADASRRKIIELLREAGELKVGDIAAAFSMSLNGVSKHVKVLERAGLVVRRRDGRAHWLRVNWEALQMPYEWLHFYRHFWGGRLDSLVDYVNQIDSSEKEEIK